MTDDALVRAAIEARAHAWSPYSGFAVGAALLCADGTVYTGCNVENVTFGLTTCAEQVAILKAVSEGRRAFTKVAVVSPSDPPAAPCGLCRQMMVEFAADLEVLICSPAGVVERTTLAALLPRAFRPADLEDTSA